MILLLIATSVLVVLWMRHKSEDFAHKFILVLLFANFALHFLKIFLPSYFGDLPYSLKKISPDNICAVSVIFFPFFYLWGNKYFKDYMFYLGIISGFAVYLYPASYDGYIIDGLDEVVEIARFYLCHMPLVIAPLVMISTGLHRLDHRRVFVTPLIFLGILTLVGVNEVLLKLSGIVDCTWQEVFSNNYRNGALVFGPMSVLDSSLGWLYWLIPSFFRYTWPGTSAVYYVPVLWMAIPTFVVMSLGFYAISLPWTHREAYVDYVAFIQRLTMKRMATP